MCDGGQAVLVAVLRDLFRFLGRGDFCFLAIELWLDRLHAAEAADIANDRTNGFCHSRARRWKWVPSSFAREAADLSFSR